MTVSEPFSTVYRVFVYDEFKRQFAAYVELAEKDDIFNLDLSEWNCDWKNIWAETDFGCEGIIKLTYGNNILGLAKLALYPYPCRGERPNYLEICNIEAVSGLKRSVNPIGFWLIWFSIKIAFEYCDVDPDLGYLITLDSLQEAMSYYQNKVKMQAVRWITISPDEEGYVFIFEEEEARRFLSRIETRYGRPVLLRR